MWQNLTGWHALVVLAIIVLVFGAAKLPSLARSVGQSVRILRAEAGDPDPAPRDPTPDASPPALRHDPRPVVSAPSAGESP